MPRPAVPALACLLLLPIAGPVAAAEVTTQQINRAIERIQQHFFEAQSDRGLWGSDTQVGHQDDAWGETALVTYALLSSGAHAQDPRIERALERLRNAKPEGTYARAIRNHVWAALPASYSGLMERDTDWLLRAENGNGGFRYTRYPGDDWDNSATQYGVLGVWEAAKRGVAVPDRFWQRTLDHYLRTQREDGGWNYQQPSEHRRARGSMVAAGLAVDYIALQQLHRTRPDPPARIRNSIRRGMRWLDNHFSGQEHPSDLASPNEYFYYYLYGIERVGLASGVRYLNGKPWFEAGAAEILSRQDEDGKITATHWRTAFALLYLARGKVPVWANKLELADHPWNRRPNDLFFLTKYLSEYAERRLSWVRAPMNRSARDWLTAPVLYLSTNEPLTLDDKQREKLKRYIKLGGLLVINPEGGNQTAIHSLRSLARGLFPRYQLRSIGDDHPLTDLVVSAPEASRIRSVSNGARDLILLLPSDWGRRWQAETGRARRGTPWQAAVNLFALTTNRGRISGRLDDPLVPRGGEAANEPIKVVRARYDGNWRPEPLALAQLDQYLKSKADRGLNLSVEPLRALGAVEAPLVHLAGVEAYELSPAEREAIRRYVRGGGTLLVETVGGRGAFAYAGQQRGVVDQLREVFGATPSPLPRSSPIITGQGLEHGAAVNPARYRPYSVVNRGLTGPPPLTVIRVDGRPGVIISAEDLSVGTLGVPRWGVHGYQPESARQLMSNLVLHAAQ